MSADQITIIIILVITFALFLWGRWRFDVVAFISLLTTSVLGLIPVKEAFDGFSNPATITVVEVLIISRALKSAGVAELITSHLRDYTKTVPLHIASVAGVGAFLSSFMNNVGAIALMIPTAIQSSVNAKRSASLLLMPLSFATILGGLVTLIGTPPNIIIAAYRQKTIGESFSMFDFAYVGLPVAIGGVLFVSILGWRFLTKEIRSRKATKNVFTIENYITEVELTEKSEIVGKTVKEIKETLDKQSVSILGVVHKQKFSVPSSYRSKLQKGDILLLEAAVKDFQSFTKDNNLKFVEVEDHYQSLFQSNNIGALELILSDESVLVGRKRTDFNFRRRFGAALLAISRRGKSYRGRLKDIKFEVGDVLLFYGNKPELNDLPGKVSGLLLDERDINISQGSSLWLPIVIFIAAVTLATFEVVPLQIAFGFAIAAMVLFGVIPMHDLYKGIDWPVIVLLGSLIPIGGAFERTGLAEVIVNSIFANGHITDHMLIIFLLMAVTMSLTDIMNNTATAVIMAPIAVNIAQVVGIHQDALLMTIAVAASCSFLTPIGHKNNALVMGPGGYKFGDYWRMGLPLEVVIVLIATPLLYYFWA